MSAIGTKRTSELTPPMSAFGGKADIPKRRFDHFQPASLTRYDALLGALGARNATTRFY
jgi:hypothetical protein